MVLFDNQRKKAELELAVMKELPKSFGAMNLAFGYKTLC
jgi:hypothetical protein